VESRYELCAAGSEALVSLLDEKAAAMGYDDALIEASKLVKDPNYMTKLPLEDDD
jgi:hypothetical protein